MNSVSGFVWHWLNDGVMPSVSHSAMKRGQIARRNALHIQAHVSLFDNCGVWRWCRPGARKLLFEVKLARWGFLNCQGAFAAKLGHSPANIA